MLRLTQNIALFSLRLKGPTTQRILLREGKFKTEPIVEDFFGQYYNATVELYKNNFTPEEMENASESVKRVFSLRNATPAEILKFRISQAVKKYQNSFNDHGSAAVQCASMSERIILLMMHVKKYPKDTKAARYLTKLLDQRRNMLDYLVKKDYHRYAWVCTDYGIPQTHAQKAIHRRDCGLKENISKKTFS